MNALYAFLTNPLFVKFLSLLTEKFLEWEKAQKKETFRLAIKKAIATGDQRELDGGEPSNRPGVKTK